MKKLYKWMSMALVVLMLTACTSGGLTSEAQGGAASAQSSASGETAGGTGDAAGKNELIVALGSDITSLDPTNHTTFPNGSVLFAIYDPLVTRDEDGTIVPWLAESFELQDDQLTWQFTLKQGVYFTNGQEFNAECVKFTLDRALENSTGNVSRIQAISSVDIVDDYTVNICTEEPSPTLLAGLCEEAFVSLMLPANYEGDFETEPCGTGPYKYVEWKLDEHIILEANPDYWGGAPEIETIKFRPIPEISTRISELKSGGVDLIGDLPPEFIDEVNGISDLEVVSEPTDRMFYLRLDLLNDSPLQDKKVRQAIMYAIDAEAINEGLLGGLGSRMSVVLPSQAFGYNAGLVPYSYNPDKAKELLAEAGYAEGFTITLTSRNGRYLKDKEIVEACAAYLGQVGIVCEVEFVEGGVWTEITNAKGMYGLSYPGWSGLDADLVYYPQLYTGQSQSYVSDPYLDDLIIQGRSTMNETERMEIYTEISEYLYEEMYQVPLFQSPAIYGKSISLNWNPGPDDLLDFRGASFS